MYAFANKAMSTHCKASLMPAAAVISAAVAYSDVVDVKKLVVDCSFHSREGKTVSVFLLSAIQFAQLRHGSDFLAQNK